MVSVNALETHFICWIKICFIPLDFTNYLGYNLTPQALSIIVKRYSDNGRIKFDDFVAAATRLRILTGECFKLCNLFQDDFRLPFFLNTYTFYNFIQNDFDYNQKQGFPFVFVRVCYLFVPTWSPDPIQQKIL